MRKELDIFLTALMFFTRIPVPRRIYHNPDLLQKATRYFPWIGILVGAVAGLFYLAGTVVFPMPIAVYISMLVSIFLTGAFHEDGFADFCDGFGGGWTKEKILLIMKDSRLGTFGVIGLSSVLGFKFLLLLEMSTMLSGWNVFSLIIAAHSTSRLSAITLIQQYKYVKDDQDSKTKPVAATKLQATELFIALSGGLLPLVVLNSRYLLALIPVAAVRLYLGAYFRKWIGGYTGDCLGAVQQVCEIALYFGIYIVWKFI